MILGDGQVSKWYLCLFVKNLAAPEHLQAFVSQYADEPTLSKELYIFTRIWQEWISGHWFQIRGTIRAYANKSWSLVRSWNGFLLHWFRRPGKPRRRILTFSAVCCIGLTERDKEHSYWYVTTIICLLQNQCETAVKQLSDNPAMIWVQHGLVLVCLDRQAMQNAYDTFEGMLINYEKLKIL